MAIPPTQLQVGSNPADTYNAINDNFANAVQSIKDLGANLSTSLTISFTAAASTVTNNVITLTSKGAVSTSINQVFTNATVSSVTGITPYLDIYIDHDNDPNWLWPNGVNITGTVGAMLLNSVVFATPYTNSLAAWLIQLNNRDTVSHTYYLHNRCGYFPTGQSGQYR